MCKSRFVHRCISTIAICLALVGLAGISGALPSTPTAHATSVIFPGVPRYFIGQGIIPAVGYDVAYANLISYTQRNNTYCRQTQVDVQPPVWPNALHLVQISALCGR